MKTSTILTTTSLIALLSSSGLLACSGAEVRREQSQSAGLTQPAAETPPPAAVGHDARPGHHGARGKHRGPPSPEKLLERFDDNKNGQLEAAELPERMQQHIGDIDSSGDSIVSKDELAAHFKARAAERHAKFAERAKARFEKKDANHDGTLDQAEVGAERWTKLSVADANGDQKLTPEELKAAFESGKLEPHGMRGKHGRRWQGDAPDAPPAAAPAAPTPSL